MTRSEKYLAESTSKKSKNLKELKVIHLESILMMYNIQVILRKFSKNI